MPFDQNIIQKSNPYKQDTNFSITRTIYYGEVVSIDDPTDGGRIKVKISGLDNVTDNENLPWCYPMMPKFFHIYPKVGEMVRIFIEDIKYPQRSRFWLGSIISQPQKISYDTIYTALSTTNMGVTNPEPAPNTYPNAKGVYPDKEDVAIIGRVNTDFILKPNQLHLRAGKHDNNNVLKLNVKNPAHLSLIFEPKENTNDYYSNSILFSDKIALISHDGNPKFKASDLNLEDRTKIFNEGHPIPRGDVLVDVLKIIIEGIVDHIHGYSNLPADKSSIINRLETIDLNAILQKNIVVN